MKKTSCFIFIFLFSLFVQAQTKKWTLEECVKYAMDNNISIKQTALNSKNAAIDKKVALGNFLPSVNGSAQHSWNIGLNQDITTGLLRNQTTQFTSLGLTAGVDIYNGLQNQNRLIRANLALVANQYQTLKMQEDVALYVANAYLQILFNKENLKVQQKSLANTEKQLIRAQELVNAGVTPKGDLFDMQATLASDQQKIIVAENVLLISQLTLAQLLQLPDFINFDVAGEENIKGENNILGKNVDDIYNKAKQERTELKIAQTNIELAERDIKIAKGAYQPRLNGFYSFNTRASYSDVISGSAIDSAKPISTIGFLQSNPSELVGTPNFKPVLGSAPSVSDQFSANKGQNFGLNLSVPIFNGLSVKNNVERSKVALERSKLAYSQGQLDLQRNVYTAFTDAKGALKANEAAISALSAREEAFKYAKERYDVGMMNAFDFNQSQTLYANSISEVLRTKYDYLFKVKILEFYFGIPILKN